MTDLPEPPFILVCRDCGDGDDARPLEFGSQAERGRWASRHTRETGHHRWGVFASLEDMAESRERDERWTEGAAITEAALAALRALHADATVEQMTSALAKVRKGAE